MVKMRNLVYDVGEKERGKLGWARHQRDRENFEYDAGEKLGWARHPKKRDREIRGKCGDRDDRRGGLRYREIAPRQPRSEEINWERGKLGREIARRHQHEGVRCERNLSRREIEWNLKHRDRGRLIFEERDREIYGRKFEKRPRREILRQKETRYQAPCEGWKRERRSFSPRHEKRYKFSHRRPEREVESLKRYRSYRFIEEEEDISTSEESRSESGSEAVHSGVLESFQFGKIAYPDSFQYGKIDYPDSFQYGKIDYPDTPPPFDKEKYSLTPSRREPELGGTPIWEWSPGPPETPRPPRRHYSRREAGRDGKHWCITVEPKLFPCPYPKRKDMIIVYLKVLAQLLGNKERALKSIYAVYKSSVGCRISGKVARKCFSMKMKGVSVSLDRYMFVNGEFITGKYCKDGEIFPLPGVDSLDYYRRELDRWNDNSWCSVGVEFMIR